MLQMNYGSITVLYLCVLSGAIMGQAGAPKPPPASAVLASSGSFQLTEQMIDQALRFGQILAGADFSPSDAAAMRSGLIATFRKEPVKETADYESVAKILKQTAGRKASWLDLALIRYKVWQSYGENQQAFRDLQSSPFGKMVLKYNPVLVNSGGMVVTKTDVDCQYFSDALVAKAAGMAPPTEAEKDRFAKSLPSQFASLPREQQELRSAELRLVDFYTAYEGTIKTRAIVAADIRKSVHSSADVWREARQVENDAQYGARYYQLYRNEALTAGLDATRVNADILGLGRLGDSVMRNGGLYGPNR